jgi:hypothetical protein
VVQPGRGTFLYYTGGVCANKGVYRVHAHSGSAEGNKVGGNGNSLESSADFMTSAYVSFCFSTLLTLRLIEGHTGVSGGRENSKEEG